MELIQKKFRRWLRIFKFASMRFLNEQYTYRASARRRGRDDLIVPQREE